MVLTIQNVDEIKIAYDDIIHIILRNQGKLFMISYSHHCENIIALYNGARHRLSSRLASYSKRFLERLVGDLKF